MLQEEDFDILSGPLFFSKNLAKLTALIVETEGQSHGKVILGG